jgi:hypothetical protein
MHAIPRALARLAGDLGVRLEYGVPMVLISARLMVERLADEQAVRA